MFGLIWKIQELFHDFTVNKTSPRCGGNGITNTEEGAVNLMRFK